MLQPVRLYADTFTVWIYKDPARSRFPVGYLRGGQSVALRGAEPRGHSRCPGGWFEVIPAGFICLESGVSVEPTRYNLAMQSLAARSGAYPFDYGISRGITAFRRIPKSGEGLGLSQRGPLDATFIDTDMLDAAGLAPTPLPWFLENGGSVARENEERLVRREVPMGTLLSLVSRFDADGASFYQAADGTIVPSTGVELLRRSAFAGIRLSATRSLPLAWPRASSSVLRLTETCRQKLARDMPPKVVGRLSAPIHVRRTCFEATPDELPARSPITLTGQRVVVDGKPLLETEDGGWVSSSNMYLALAENPKHALAHAADKWIHFSIQQGTLVSYEGEQPVFATLASPGNGESNSDGRRRLTPKGTFRINFKHLADDMSREEGEHRSEWKADVPFAMYFKHPYGIHVSYWHEQFGEPMSGGCINVSPLDGRTLFDWTDPPLPEGWFGVGSSKEFGLGTVVHISD